ncbi:hypothetical protein tloyanaT_18150 [Thalassotalea loyana]|uniref:SGNH/GDSL hydrolase family protein n=1 Tax=Thalassotalea loyana TaxID=280483 RepID=A0ABQ6HBS7_9GAMM|nr:hypothetical protein [Thalassotalea loyana]GLX85563.1 hypothetical protein tloyanaT_18150 [Thalassotalea loyana]
MRLFFQTIAIITLLTSCSGDSTTEQDRNEQSLTGDVTSNLPIPDNRFKDSYQILIFGNSHIINIGSLIETMIKADNPDAQTQVVNQGGGFLDDNTTRSRRLSRIEGQQWSHIILQGQKYSQSGIVEYPTRSAERWIGIAKEHGIMPVLFPEHPRRGNTEEGQRVHEIHTGIAARQKSCVAPIGLAWDRALTIQPGLALHASDGNHASALGRVLTAYVFYEVITGQPADLLPIIESLNVSADLQQLFKQVASETISANEPCGF